MSGGRKLVLVGHSQGNLYANEAWNGLTADERMATHLVAVATPADIVSDGGHWRTLHKDKIATTIFAAIGALPSNTDMNETCADKILNVIPVSWLCHGFKEAYMLGDEPRTKIVNDIVALLPSSPVATINFETPSLGANDRREINPYVDGALLTVGAFLAVFWL